MVNSITLEIHQSLDYLPSKEVNTIYFGGGTPSVLSSSQLDHLLQAIQKNYHLSSDLEITLEANPDDLQKAKEWHEVGINRLSIGVQSFNDKHLQFMNRIHDAQQAIDGIKWVQDMGIDNLSIDLIYGVPGLSIESWRDSLNLVNELGVQHLSCYALTVEERTSLYHLIQDKKIPPLDEDLALTHFEALQVWANAQHWDHYEISNLCKAGFQAKHNSKYWQGIPYLGLGPGAHSFNGHSRKWNLANNALYIRNIQNGIPTYEEEILTEANRINEYIMTCLRTSEGINFDVLKAKFVSHSYIEWRQYLDQYSQYFIQKNNWSLKPERRFQADGIASDLFVEE
jgi:oxygen-independent coproporphyrinogen-3 oxidase